MKKIFVSIFAILMLVLMVSCKPNEQINLAQVEAEDFIMAVDAFGDVQITKQEELKELKDHFLGLSNEALSLAEEASIKLKELDVGFLELLIMDYGTVTLENLTKINAALLYYDTLLDKDLAVDLKTKLDEDKNTYQTLLNSETKKFDDIMTKIIVKDSDRGTLLDSQQVFINEAFDIYNGLHKTIKELDQTKELYSTLIAYDLAIKTAIRVELNDFNDKFEKFDNNEIVSGLELDERVSSLNILRDDYESMSKINKLLVEFDYELLFNNYIEDSVMFEISKFNERLDLLKDDYDKEKNVATSLSLINQVNSLIEKISTYNRTNEVILDTQNYLELVLESIPGFFKTDVLSLLDYLEKLEEPLYGQHIDELDLKYYIYLELYDNTPEVSQGYPEGLYDLESIRNFIDEFVLEELTTLRNYVASIPNEFVYSNELYFELKEIRNFYDNNLSLLALEAEDINDLLEAINIYYIEFAEYVDVVVIEYEYEITEVDPLNNRFKGNIKLYVKVLGPSGNEITTIDVIFEERMLEYINGSYFLEYPFVFENDNELEENNYILVSEDIHYLAGVYSKNFDIIAKNEIGSVEVEILTPLDSLIDVELIDDIFKIKQGYTKTNTIIDFYTDKLITTMIIDKEEISLFELRRHLFKNGFNDPNGYQVKLHFRRTTDNKLFADSLETITETITLYPTEDDVLKAPTDIRILYLSRSGSNGVLEANRANDLFDVANENVDHINLYLFDDNTIAPNADNAIAVIKHKWVNGKFVGFVNDTEYVYTDVYGHNNLYLNQEQDGNTSKMIIQALELTGKYDRYKKYYLANQVIIKDGGEFDLDGDITNYFSSYFQEEVYVEPADKPDATNKFAYAESQNGAFAFDRYDELKINSKHIKEVIVYIYHDILDDKDTGYIGMFTFYYRDGDAYVMAGEQEIKLQGNVGNYYTMDAHQIMISALGENFALDTDYYLSNQIIVAEGGNFINNSDISEIHPQSWSKLS